ncbi:hypothetical protein D9758_002004 [Tetrapyrgos nigripes]|uniref:Mitochondrial intermembrane space import and assembly protein 40 n=1 Tax=Tetrapyrgos nigripes TaxID=182062 RepID=A0A8H5GTC6_9AGAR|nr:hypothetical protein D9758_002004 [Tetrapyrgos nigripes]
MFSQSWRRFPLRRCLHTQVSPPARLFNTRLALALGVSAATASYLTYRLTFDQRIALDSVSSAPKTPHPSSETSHATTSSKSDTSQSSEQSAEGDASAQEASGGGGAYNPVTGEINWDCPCLGGMAYGPCGPEFREAFSCFIYSEEEPKGINCVEKFQAMQTCFRAHPEVYADEIDDDEEEQPSSATTTEEKKIEGAAQDADASAAPSSPAQKTPEISSS